MGSKSRIAARKIVGLALASALCAPAAALAAQFDYFIKLPGVEGESQDDKHKGQIEILSYSWGATQTSHGTGAGGMGAGKVSMQDIAAPSATSGGHKTSKVESISIKQSVPAGAAAKDEAISDGMLIVRGANEQPGAAGKPTPPTVTLKRGTSAAAAGGVQVAAGDVTGDGAPAASGLPTGKRQHKPLMLSAPLAQGSVTVRGKFPSCTVGTRYPSLELGARAARFRLHDVVITSCGGDASAGDAQPMEEVSFNYTKIEF